MTLRATILLPLLLAGAACGQAPDAALPSFTGQAACLECHDDGRAARGCALEPIPKHARTLRLLEREAALSIAALCGIGEPPPESRLCLGCHATSADEGPRWRLPSFSLADGVQCEACHGPGGLHAEAHRRGAGAPELPEPSGIRRGDREDCQQCHRKRPSHDEVLEHGFRLPEVDRDYKTPVNLAPSPDGRRLYVVCEHGDSVVALDPASGDVLGEVAVGRRPHGVAVSPDGARLYVTNRFSRSVSVIDAGSLKVVAEIPVGDEPHGIATTAAGDRIYVLNTGDDTISVLDAARLTETKRLAAGNGPWSLALRPGDGSLVVTSVRPRRAEFREPHRSELTVVSTREDVVRLRAVAADANMLQGVAPVPGRDVTLFTLVRTKDLVPMTRLAQGWVITNGLGVLWGDGRVDQVLLDEPNRSFPDPDSLAVSPDGRFAAVTSGGSDEVALVDVGLLLETITSAPPGWREEVLPNHLGQSGRFVVRRARVGVNPRGLAWSPDGAHIYVALALEDSVAVLDAETLAVRRSIRLPGPSEITAIRAGERLFHSAAFTHGSQFSCRSCHPDGHINGLTFDIEADGLGLHPVDNRTLRGIFDTPPFKWEGTNPSLPRQCGARFAVFFTRLDPFSAEELAALARYVETLERPPNLNRAPDGLSLTERRGKAVFERTRTNLGHPIAPERRCNVCHGSPYRSAGFIRNVGSTMWFDSTLEVPGDDLRNAYDFGPLGLAAFQDQARYSRSFDVSHLTNIYDSPPYLHNGAAATLEEIWTVYNLYEQHGVTHDLTRRQLNDLVAYLRTL